MESPVEVVFALEEAPHDRKTGSLVDLDDEGLFLASNQIWPPRTALTLFLGLPGERVPVRISGEVAWARTRGIAGMYVRFTEPADHPTRAKLKRPAAAPPRVGAKPRG